MYQCIMIMAKEPLAGQVKTRLAAGTGAARALDLYRAFLADTIATARRVPHTTLGLAYWPTSARAYFAMHYPGMVLVPQQGVDLGARLLSVFEQAQALGFKRCVVVSSDSPNLPVAYLERAFALLDDTPVVLGPCDDGGYYLIGMRTPQPALFHDIAWSTSIVYQQTCARAAAAGIAVATLPPWYDIDTVDDLPRLHADVMASAHATATRTVLQSMAEPPPSIVAIIPALNEAEAIRYVVDAVPRQLVQRVIVIDNGSTDGTAQAALAAGAEVVVQPQRGYGNACRAGVDAAGAVDILVFVDGDGSFDAAQCTQLVAPILAGHADLVLGSRELGGVPNSAILRHQRLGNRLVAWLVRRGYGVAITDMGPFRAISSSTLAALQLQEPTYGWPTEMLVKAARHHARIVEVPVTYRPRIGGVSKVSGTLRGTLLAGYRMLALTLKHSRGRL